MEKSVGLEHLDLFSYFQKIVFYQYHRSKLRFRRYYQGLIKNQILIAEYLQASRLSFMVLFPTCQDIDQARLRR